MRNRYRQELITLILVLDSLELSIISSFYGQLFFLLMPDHDTKNINGWFWPLIFCIINPERSSV